VGKHEGKRQLGRPRFIDGRIILRWIFKRWFAEVMDWIDVA
jgi:hypothetical protein